jgi:hypothetical protein
VGNVAATIGITGRSATSVAVPLSVVISAIKVKGKVKLLGTAVCEKNLEEGFPQGKVAFGQNLEMQGSPKGKVRGRDTAKAVKARMVEGLARPVVLKVMENHKELKEQGQAKGLRARGMGLARQDCPGTSPRRFTVGTVRTKFLPCFSRRG